MSFTSLDDLLRHGFDAVIDVRSPAEYADDHIPGAINLPALDNAQRARVGTIYKQVSPFDARKMGAAMVARNVADHVDGPLAAKDGGWRPLVYCWRGGQRSGSFASILSQIGWRAQTIQGGYQTYRRLVNDMLHLDPLAHRLILLDGYTGTAKTDILARSQARGAQVLDLEALAQHRGSLLGGMSQNQPSQKGFETALAVALNALDPARPVLVEAESSKIGRITLPPSLWQAMLAAPRIVITAPLAARAQYLTQTYADIIANPDEVARRLAPLRRIRGHTVVDGWDHLLRAGDFPALAAALMTQHYDPAYAKSRRIDERQVIATVHAPTLDDAGQEYAADAVSTAISAL